MKENIYERCRLEVALMTCHLKFNVQLEKVMLFTSYKLILFLFFCFRNYEFFSDEISMVTNN